MAGIFLRVFYS